MTQTLTLQDNRWLQNNKLSYPCVLALWHRLWHFKKTDKVITVCQHYDTYIDTARKQMKLSLCVSIDTDFDTSKQEIKLSLCVSIVTQTMTLQENRSYPCVSALWHRHWHFKTTDKVIPVYQHYDTDIDTSRQQKKLPRCVSIMTDIHTSRQQKKLPLCVSIMTRTLTLQDNKWSYTCVSIMTQTLTLQDNIWSYPCVSALTLQEKRWSYPCMSALWQTFTFLDNRFNFPFGIFTGFLSLLVNFTTCDVTSRKQMLYLFVCLMVFNATFNNISVI